MDQTAIARWLPVQPAASSLPVFCFPFAGGGISLFRTWQALVPEPVQICPVALPGREKRLAEPSIASLEELVATICDLLRPYLHHDFVLYGHCFGGSLAFEVALALQNQGFVPTLLAVSGCRAPHLPPPFRIADLPEEEFIEALRRFRLTPETVLALPELLALFLPALRTDFALDERMIFSGQRPVLASPLLVLHGTRDAIIPVEAASEWQDYSTRGCDFVQREGAHIFFDADPTLVLRPLIAKLQEGTIPSDRN